MEHLDAVLIDSPTTGLKMTKKDVHDYYATPEVQRKLLAYLRGKDLLTVMNREPNKPIVRKYRKVGEPIQAGTPSNLEWYTQRRYTEFHPLVADKTDQVWVDIDPGKGVSADALKPAVKDVVKALEELPEVTSTNITFSGGRGFHVRGQLEGEKSTVEMRKMVQRAISKLTHRSNPYTTRPPEVGQIRLDTSTFHPQGSIRAPYSLNSETGLVAVPLKERELQAFDPATDATPWAVLLKLRRKGKVPEYAPGIPRDRATHPLPEFNQPKTWMMSVQEHNADRAGKHYDLRLVDPWSGRAHSWAVPKARLPEKGDKAFLAVQTPTHSASYALTFGAGAPRDISKGYGKGTVEIKHKVPIEVVSSSPNRVKFRGRVGDEERDFVLFRTKEDKWLLRNVTREKQGSDMSQLFWRGYDDMLQKLGASKKLTSMIKQKRLSTGESQRPLELGDSNLPAGELASVLGMLRVPTRSQGDAATDSIEQRLNQPTSWGPKEEISTDTATGPSPIGLGY